jgi:hypothetical protein
LSMSPIRYKFVQRQRWTFETNMAPSLRNWTRSSHHLPRSLSFRGNSQLPKDDMRDNVNCYQEREREREKERERERDINIEKEREREKEK